MTTPRNYQRGSDRHNAKLTEEDVRNIRSLSTTTKDESLAAQFGVSKQNIEHIRTRRTWRHIP